MLEIRLTDLCVMVLIIAAGLLVALDVTVGLGLRLARKNLTLDRFAVSGEPLRAGVVGGIGQTVHHVNWVDFL